MNEAQPEKEKKPILCLDFDGVCHSYESGWQGETVIPDPPVAGFFEFLDGAFKYFDVFIYGSRSRSEKGRLAMENWFRHWREKWCKENPHKRITPMPQFPSNKPPAFVGLDDRVILFTGKWPSLPDLQEFRPWYRKDVD